MQLLTPLDGKQIRGRLRWEGWGRARLQGVEGGRTREDRERKEHNKNQWAEGNFENATG